MNTERIPGLAISFKTAVVLAVFSLCSYLVLFGVNLVSTKQQLAELARLSSALESAANLRGSLSRLVLDDSRLDNRRAVPTEEVEQLKRNAEESSEKLNRDIAVMEALLGADAATDFQQFRARLDRLQSLSGRHAELLNKVYDPGGLLPQFLRARQAADDAFTVVSEAVPLPTRNYLATKANQNSFLAGHLPREAEDAKSNLQAYKREAGRFPGLKARDRLSLENTAEEYLVTFGALSSGLIAADDVQREIQSIWTELLPVIDRLSAAVTVRAAEEADTVTTWNRALELISAALALLIASCFTGVAHAAYRFGAERDRRLRQSNARFRDLAHASSDVFMELDADGQIVMIEGERDPIVEEYGPEIVNRSFSYSMDVLGMMPVHRQPLVDAFATRRPFRDIEYCLTQPRTGEQSWYSASGMPIVQDGEFGGFRCALRNITDRVAKDKQLFVITTAVDNASDGVLLFEDFEGPVVYANAAIKKMFALPPDLDLRGKYVADFLPSGSRERAKALRADAKRVLAQGEGWNSRIYAHRADGVAVSMDFRGTLLPDGRFLSLVTDVTEQTRLEEQIKHNQAERDRLLANLPGAAYRVEWTGAEYVAGFISRRIEAITGYAGQQLVDCKSDGTRLLPMDDALARQRELDTARTEGRPYDITWRLRTQNEELKWILERGEHFTLADGRIVAEGYLTDITDRVNKDAEEQALRRRLSDAQRFEAIGSLAGGIAHDFNNIIGAARGFADLLVEDLPDGEPKRYAERIVATCRRAALLVREIMAFSRVNDEVHDVVDVDLIVDEARDVLVGRAGQAIRLNVRNDAQGWQVRGNHSQLSQVISNVIVNAADATPDKVGDVEMRVSCLMAGDRRLSDADWLAPTRITSSGRVANVVTQGILRASRDYLCICIADRGTGMPEAVLKRIFEPFYTTKEKSRGTGLGLAVVASIVNAHEGAIQVGSLAGAGTRFEIFLPLAAKTERRHAATPAIFPASEPVRMSGRERILIVDDEVDIADSLAIALGRLGYETAPIYDPKEALEVFNENPDAWDVVISDQSMPRLRGVQLMRKMRTRRPDIRTIICTGHSDALTPERAAAEGIDRFFHKPVAAETLAQTIRGLFSRDSVARAESSAAH